MALGNKLFILSFIVFLFTSTSIFTQSKKTNELISGFVEYTTFVTENGKRVQTTKKRPKQKLADS